MPGEIREKAPNALLGSHPVEGLAAQMTVYEVA
jgi:hypothetical protein